MLAEQQIERYSRQIILPGVGGRGQERLLSSAIAIADAGPVAGTAALYLAAAGVGRLTIVPRETEPSASNAVMEDLRDLNPDVRFEAGPRRLTPAAATDLAREHDLVIDAGGLDAEPQQLLNAACVALRRPLLWAQARGSIGRVGAFAGHRADIPCRMCVHPETSAIVAVSDPALEAAAAALVGAIQATESVKLLLGIGSSVLGRMWICDVRAAAVQEIRLSKDPQCTVCRPSEADGEGGRRQ